MKRMLFNTSTIFQPFKSLLIAGLLSSGSLAFGSVKTTVADGNWFDDANWSPAGVPLTEDTVIVNHDMTATGSKIEFGTNWLIVNHNASISCDSAFVLHGSLRLYGSMNVNTYADGDGSTSYVHGELTASLLMTSNPETFNYGTITSDSLIISDDFHNYGLIDSDFLAAGDGAAPFVNHSSAAIVSGGLVMLMTEAVNETNATMVLNELMTDVLLTNNGSVSCVNWSHFGGVANGDGRYCIEACFMNFAAIEGTLDICDATPSESCDLALGTMDGTVTSCTAPPCTNNLGIDENRADFRIYPNPATEYITLKTDGAENIWKISDVNGKVVSAGLVSTELMQIDISYLPSGVYLLQLQTEKGTKAHRFLKN